MLRRLALSLLAVLLLLPGFARAEGEAPIPGAAPVPAATAAPAPEALRAATLRPDLMAGMQRDLLDARLPGLVDRVRAGVEEDLRGRGRIDPAVVRELVALHTARVVESERLGSRSRDWLARALAERSLSPEEAGPLAERWSTDATSQWSEAIEARSMAAMEASLEGRMAQKLSRFGENFFSRSTEEGSSEVAVPHDYRLAPGDRLDVVIFNVRGGESTTPLVLDARGSAFVPGVGSVQLGGLTRDQAEGRIQGLMGSRFKNMRVRLELGKVAPLRVFVVGEARRPGGYLVNPGSTALDALLSAGGPSDRGSYRRVEVQRAGRTLAVLDLYDFLATGRPLHAPELQSQDRLFIPVSGTEVEVSGQVARPAIYELLHEKRLSQVLALAGGVSPDAYSPRLQVERVSKGKDRILLEVELARANATMLQPGDRVQVFSVLDDLTNGVYLDGQVERPGWYAWTRGLTVSELLVRAQGLRPSASHGHAEIYRGNPGRPTEVLGFRLDDALARRNDPALEPGDRLVVFAGAEVAFDSSKVQVRGAVSRPGEYQRYSGMRVADLLGRAGGVLPEAAVEAEIARTGPDGRVERLPIQVDQALATPTSSANLLLQDFDLLIVRPGLNARRYPATITLSGEVARPGEYSVDPATDTLADVIRRAGGLTGRAFPKGAIFLRHLPNLVAPENRDMASRVFVEIQTIARQVAAVELARDGGSPADIVTAMGGQPVASGETSFLPPRVIDKILTTGRVPVNLAAVVDGDRGLDPGLRDGDILHVPEEPRTVVVSGAVAMPSALLHQRGWRYQDYIRRTGGYALDADEDKVLVMRVNGELMRAEQAGAIEPGDLLLVPPRAIVAEPDGYEIFLQALQIITNGAVLSRILR